MKNPARTVPRAIYLALAITTVLYLLIQFVAQGTFGARPRARDRTRRLPRPRRHFSATAGTPALVAAATISSFGFVASDILSSPRILFALGRDGILPTQL